LTAVSRGFTWKGQALIFLGVERWEAYFVSNWRIDVTRRKLLNSVMILTMASCFKVLRN
jgi:hypothetical protein